MENIATLMESLVARIMIAGASSAVFTYLLILGFLRPWTKNTWSGDEEWVGELMTNFFALLLAMLFAVALVFILTSLTQTAQWIEALLIGVIGFGVATYGHEVLSNWQKRREEPSE